MQPTAVVFDLDDTLYPEIDFLHSAYRHIARDLGDRYGLNREEMCRLLLDHGRKDAFDVLDDYLHRHVSEAPEDVEWMVNAYRVHHPDLRLPFESLKVLNILQSRGAELALITDGRCNTQFNKILALGLGQWFLPDRISISEMIGADKYQPDAFRHVMETLPDHRYFYVGDSTDKDFIWPNRLGWTSVCLRDKGRNIHAQDFTARDDTRPAIVIDRLLDLLPIVGE